MWPGFQSPWSSFRLSTVVLGGMRSAWEMRVSLLGALALSFLICLSSLNQRVLELRPSSSGVVGRSDFPLFGSVFLEADLISCSVVGMLSPLQVRQNRLRRHNLCLKQNLIYSPCPDCINQGGHRPRDTGLSVFEVGTGGEKDPISAGTSAGIGERLRNIQSKTVMRLGHDECCSVTPQTIHPILNLVDIFPDGCQAQTVFCRLVSLCYLRFSPNS